MTFSYCCGGKTKLIFWHKTISIVSFPISKSVYKLYYSKMHLCTNFIMRTQMEDAPSRKRDGDFTRSGLGLVNGGGELFGFGFYLNFNGSAALNRIL